MSAMEKKQRLVIGRKDKVDFPKLGLYDIDAKVDTGAYTSSIHCRDLKVIDKDGEKHIRFSLVSPSHPSYNKLIARPIYAKRSVKNSFGQIDKRYIIKTQISLFGERLDIELSLTDRSKMDYPVLLGRKLLNKRFVVDVSQSDLSYRQKNKTSASKVKGHKGSGKFQ